MLWMLLIILCFFETSRAQSPSPDPLPEKQFVIQNDICGQYFVPEGQQLPLVYDQRVTYTYNSFNRQTWYSYTGMLKLPVICMRCQKEIDLNIVLQGKGQTTSMTFDQYMQSVDPIQKPVYFGSGFFNGSALCLEKQPDGRFDLNAFWKSQMVQQDVSVQKEINDQLIQFNTQTTTQQVFALSKTVSELTFPNSIFKQELLTGLTSTNAYFEQRGQLSYFQPLQTAAWTYPNYFIKYLPVGVKTKDYCHQIDRLSFFQDNHFSAKDVAALNTIFYKGWGCLSCLPSQRVSLTSFVHFLPQIKLNGFEKEQIFPPQWRFTESEIYIERKCTAVTASIGPAGTIQLFHQFRKQAEVKNCHEEMPNCAACIINSNLEFQCQLCFDQYSLVNITNPDGTTKQACVKDFCPSGFQWKSKFNGFTYCQPCQIDKCSQCGTVNARIFDPAAAANQIKSYVVPTIAKKVDICLKCEGSLVQTDLKDKCITHREMARIKNPSISLPDTTLKVNWVVQSVDNIQTSTVTQLDIQKLQLEEAQNKFAFIQQVISKLNYLASNYTEVNATVWLTKGDHYLFACDKKIEFPFDASSASYVPLKHNVLCSMDSLVASYPKADNINIHVRALRCDSEEAKKVDQAANNLDWFNNACSNDGKVDVVDTRPVLHLNHPTFNFNITRSAVFQDVIIDGLNAFASLERTEYINGQLITNQIKVPYWPARFCKLIDLLGMVPTDAQDTELLSLVKNLNLLSNNNENLGYGNVPMQALKNMNSFMFDQVTQKGYEQTCDYSGPKSSLFNTGTKVEFVQLLKSMYPMKYGRLSQAEETQRQQMIMESIQDAVMNYQSAEFNNFSASTTNADTSSIVYGQVYGGNRRKSLFNLYAFTYTDSFQKQHPTTSSDFITTSPSPNYRIPTLKLDNVKIRNLLYDMDSLIHIETDNVIVKNDTFDQRTVLHYGNYEAQGRVEIHNSQITDCSFKKGMIHLPQKPVFTDLTNQDQVYDFHLNQKQTYKADIQQVQAMIQRQRLISVSHSKLSNLRYGQALFGLNRLEQTSQRTVSDQGSVLSLHDFKGSLKLTNNTITNNLVFIPSAILSNTNRFNQSVIEKPMDLFMRNQSVVFEQRLNETDLNLRLKLLTTNQLIGTKAFFITYFQPEDVQALRGFQSVGSAIYVEDFGQALGQVYDIKDNRFEGNVALRGAAIHLKMNGIGDLGASVNISHNLFTKNQAYFEANAVLIEGADINAKIMASNFTRNLGMVSGDGGALVVRQTAPGSKQTLVELSQLHFTQNYASQKGSCVNIENLDTVQLNASDLTFSNNTGALSTFERGHNLPFWRILTLGEYPLNYLANSLAPDCVSEVSQLLNPNCLTYRPVFNTSDLKFPNHRGAVFISNSKQANLTRCNFTHNDVGLSKQMTAQGASGVYLQGNNSKVLLDQLIAWNNSLGFLDNLLSSQNPALKAASYPSLNRSMSPLILVDNQQLGEGVLELNRSSIRQTRTEKQPIVQVAAPNADQSLTISDTNFTESVTFGSSVVQFQSGGVVRFDNNIVLQVGAIFNQTELTYPEQQQSVVSIGDAALIKPSYMHRFNNNYLGWVFAGKSSFVWMNSGATAQVKVSMVNNTVENLVSVDAAILNLQVRGSADLKQIGMVSIDKFFVRRCWAADGMIKVRDAGFSPSAQLILVIRNSTFDHNFNQVANTDKAILLADNLHLTGSKIQPTWTPSLSEAHKLLANRTLNETADILMTPLSVNATSYLTNITTTFVAHPWIEMAQSQIIVSQASNLFANTFGDQTMNVALAGFEVTEDVISSQITNSRARHLPFNLGLSSLFRLKHRASLKISHSNFTNIEALVFSKTGTSSLVVYNSTFSDLGFHFLGNQTDFKSDALSFLGVDQSDPRASRSLDLAQGILTNGVLSAKEGSSKFDNCSFTKVFTTNGMITLSSQESLEIVNSNFSRIIGNGTANLVSGSFGISAPVSIINCRVQQLVSIGSLIDLSGFTVNLINSSFATIYSLRGNGIIKLANSKLTVNNSDFNNLNPLSSFGVKATPSALNTDFGFLEYNSQLLVESSTFRNFGLGSSSFLQTTGNTPVSMNLTRFLNVSSSVVIGTAPSFAFINSSMAQSAKIKVSNTISVLVQESNFTDALNSEALWISGSSVLINSSRFEQVTSDLKSGGLVVTGAPKSEIYNSVFQKLNSNSIGAGASISATQAFLANNTFLNNSALSGGALAIGQSGMVVLNNNSFRFNRATNLTIQDFYMTRSNLRGGGMFIDCQPASPADCNVTLNSSNFFEFNSAKLHGGAISVKNGSLDVGNSTVLTNNSAESYGGNFSSFASNFTFKFDSLRTFTVNETFNDSVANVTFNKSLYLVPSGQPIDLNISLIDKFGNILLNEFQPVSVISLVHAKGPKGNLSSEYVTTAAQLNVSSKLSHAQVQCTNGTFIYDELIVQLPPGKRMDLKVQLFNLNPFGVNVPISSFDYHIPIMARKCVSGEEMTELGHCLRCAPGFYLLGDPTTVVNCKRCDPNAVCTGGDALMPKKGYHRYSNLSDVVIPCFNSEQCIEGTPEFPLGKCAEGYTGFMCSTCELGYAKGLWQTCSTCWNFFVSLAVLVLCLCILSFIVLKLMHFVQAVAEKKEVEYAGLVALFKILVNHAVVMVAIMNINYQWTDLLQQLFAYLAYPYQYLSTFLDLDCMLFSSFSSDSALEMDTFIRKLVALAVLPIVIWIWLRISTGCCFKRTTKTKEEELEGANYAKSVLIMAVWLIAPSTTHMVFATFACADFDNSGTKRVYHDQTLQCGTSDYNLILYLVTIPSIVLYIVGLPLWLAFKSIRNSSELRKLGDAPLEPYSPLERELIQHFGFIFLGLNYEAFYWDIFMMLTRSLIIFAQESMAAINPSVQVLVAIFFCIGNLMACVRLNPIETPLLNRLQLASIMSQLMLLYSGLFFLTSGWETTQTYVNWVFVPLAFLPNILFLFYWLYALRTQYLIIQFVHNRPLFNSLACCTNQQKFYQEHIAIRIKKVKTDQEKEDVKTPQFIQEDKPIGITEDINLQRRELAFSEQTTVPGVPAIQQHQTLGRQKQVTNQQDISSYSTTPLNPVLQDSEELLKPTAIPYKERLNYSQQLETHNSDNSDRKAIDDSQIENIPSRSSQTPQKKTKVKNRTREDIEKNLNKFQERIKQRRSQTPDFKELTQTTQPQNMAPRESEEDTDQMAKHLADKQRLQQLLLDMQSNSIIQHSHSYTPASFTKQLEDSGEKWWEEEKQKQAIIAISDIDLQSNSDIENKRTIKMESRPNPHGQSSNRPLTYYLNKDKTNPRVDHSIISNMSNTRSLSPQPQSFKPSSYFDSNLLNIPNKHSLNPPEKPMMGRRADHARKIKKIERMKQELEQARDLLQQQTNRVQK